MDAKDIEQRMLDLQKMRVAMVILLSQETSRLLSRQQRVAGKAIEVMCAERDLANAPDDAAAQSTLARLHDEETQVKDALADVETEISRMEELLAKIDSDISAMCQA